MAINTETIARSWNHESATGYFDFVKFYECINNWCREGWDIVQVYSDQYCQTVTFHMDEAGYDYLVLFYDLAEFNAHENKGE